MAISDAILITLGGFSLLWWILQPGLRATAGSYVCEQFWADYKPLIAAAALLVIAVLIGIHLGRERRQGLLPMIARWISTGVLLVSSVFVHRSAAGLRSLCQYQQQKIGAVLSVATGAAPDQALKQKEDLLKGAVNAVFHGDTSTVQDDVARGVLAKFNDDARAALDQVQKDVDGWDRAQQDPAKKLADAVQQGSTVTAIVPAPVTKALVKSAEPLTLPEPKGRKSSGLGDALGKVLGAACMVAGVIAPLCGVLGDKLGIALATAEGQALSREDKLKLAATLAKIAATQDEGQVAPALNAADLTFANDKAEMILSKIVKDLASGNQITEARAQQVLAQIDRHEHYNKNVVKALVDCYTKLAEYQRKPVGKGGLSGSTPGLWPGIADRVCASVSQDNAPISSVETHCVAWLLFTKHDKHDFQATEQSMQEARAAWLENPRSCDL